MTATTADLVTEDWDTVADMVVDTVVDMVVDTVAASPTPSTDTLIEATMAIETIESESPQIHRHATSAQVPQSHWIVHK